MKRFFLGMFIGLANFALAQNPPCQGGMGESVFATGDDIQIEILQREETSILSSDLYLWVSNRIFSYCGSGSSDGTITTVSNLVAGEELEFRIYVSTGHSFVIGPANRNPDGVAHAKIFCETNGSILIGFEDAYGGGDQNYADVLCRVSNIPARPSIVTPPASQWGDDGMNATFSVAASGTGPLFYQWFKGDVVLGNATNSSLSLTNLQDADQGTYSVLVSNALGQISSSPAQLTVNRPPVANAAAVRRLVVSPNGLNAVVTLDGSSSTDADDDALRYAWFESGATNAFAITRVALMAKPVGRHSFSLVVSDQRLSSTNEVVVTVATIPEALQNLLARVNQARLRPKNLYGTLLRAISFYGRGNVRPVKNELESFQRSVRAKVQPLNPELAAELIQLSQDILDALNAPAIQLTASASSPFQIDLAWTDISANEDGFKIERSADGVHFTQIAQVLPNTTTFRDTSLFPDTARWYRVRSFRGVSHSSYSNLRTAATPGSSCAMSLVSWHGRWWGADSPEGLRDVVRVASGWSHALALRSDGTVAEWSNHYYGEPTQAAGLSNVSAIAAGTYHSLALKNDGTVVAWGGEEYLQSTMATNLSGVVAIAASGLHNLALKNDGTVVAWGFVPSPVPKGLKGVVAVATSEEHSLALRSDGTVVAWGDDYAGQSTVPAGLRGVVAIAAASGRSLALKNDGSIASWGTWGMGQPTNTVHATAIAAGFQSSFALLPDGTVAQWGDWPPQPEGLKNVQAIFASGNTAYALTTMPPTPTIRGLKMTSPNQIQLTWSGSDLATEGYVIERITLPQPLGAPAVEAGTTPPGTTNFTDSGLIAGGTYWYHVQARNGCGKSLASFPWASISISPPTAPLGIYARIGLSNQVNVSWYDSLGNANGFVLERAPDVGGNPGGWAEIATINATNHLFNQYGFADTNVTGHTTNWYRVRAFNPLGDSAYCDPVRIEIVAPVGAPDVNAYAFQDQSILNWSFYNDNIVGFQIERAPDSDGSPGTWSIIGTDWGTQYVDAGLGLGTHWYRVRSFNWVGESPASSPVSVTIVQPNAPQIFAAVGRTNQVNVVIHPAFPNDQAGFQIERVADGLGGPGAWTEINNVSFVNPWDAYQFADTNVTANTTNWYRARSFNMLGYSDYSPAVSVELAPPPPPETPWAYVSKGQVSLRWIESFAGHLDGFQIDRAPDVDGSAGLWQRIATNTIVYESVNSYSDSGLIAGTYWYRVRAYNWLGMSSNSEPAAVTVVAPEVPRLSAQVGTTNRVEVAFFPGYPYEQDGFKLERATNVSGSPGTWSEIAIVQAAGEPYAYFTDTNVTANTTNWYRARAFNSVGYSAYSEPVEVDVVPPPPPENLFAGASGDQSTIYWRESYAGLIGGYQIDRAPDASGNPGVWSLIAVTTDADRYSAFTDTGLSLGTYWYRVRAYNWIGISSNSAPVNVTIMLPDAPQVYVSIGNTNEAKVTFNTVYRNDQDGFKLERANDEQGTPGAWSEIAIVLTTNRSFAYYTDTNVVANTTYWYRARAFNALGLSAYSSAFKVEIVPPPPPSFLSVNRFRNHAYLYWNEAHAGPIDGYLIQRAPDASSSPGPWTTIATSAGRYFYDEGLSAGTYWYRVSASNWVGVSQPSSPAKVSMAPPAAPSLYALVGNTNSVDVTISAASPYDQDGFKLEYAADAQGSPGSWMEIATIVASNQYSGTFTDSNVLANTTNWYRARSFNALGVSKYSNPARLEVLPPPAPIYLSASPFRDTMNLYWYVDYPGKLSGYQIDRAPDVLGSPGTWSPIATTTNGESRTYTDSGLGLGTYWYRVRAYNWVGVSSNSEPASGSIVTPAVPFFWLGLGASNQVGLEIIASQPPDQDGFKVERATDVSGVPGVWSEIGSIPASNVVYSSFTDTNALAYTTNWYRVRAYNSFGPSDYAAPLRIAIIPPAAVGTISSYHNSVLNLLHWEWPEGFAQGFGIERATNSASGPGTWQQIGQSFSSAYYHDYLPEPNDGAYWYRVRAFNWIGSAAYSPAVGVNLPPPSPLSVAALPVISLRITSFVLSNGSVQIEWQTTGGTTNFVEVATALEGPFAVISPPIVIPGEGVTRTNFEDSNPIFNSSQRFYRISR